MDEVNERPETPATVGAQLRAAREARGQSLDEIGRQTRVPVRHLVQIEEGRLEGLPAAPYSAGFVKAYARAVDLDPVEMSQRFRAEFAEAARAAPRIAYEPYEPADPNRLPPRLLAYVALAIAIVLIGGYAIWRSGILTGETPGERAQLAASAPDAAGPAAGNVPPAVQRPATPPPAPTGAVQLTAVQPVWFKISERNGATIFMGTLDKGQTYSVPATAQDPVIRTGRPEALQVTVGGQAVAPLGQPAHTVSDVSLKASALTGRGPAAPGAAAVRAPSAAADQPTTAAAPPAASGTGDAATPSAFRAATSTGAPSATGTPQG